MDAPRAALKPIPIRDELDLERDVPSYDAGFTLGKEASMSLARVVTFDGVTRARIDQLREQIDQEERSDDLPASEIVVLHDAEAARSLVILYFENEDDYKRGDETLSAMPADETPGQRTSVAKYEVAIRRTL